MKLNIDIEITMRIEIPIENNNFTINAIFKKYYWNCVVPKKD